MDKLTELIDGFKAALAEAGDTPTEAQVKDLAERKSAIEAEHAQVKRSREVAGNRDFLADLKGLGVDAGDKNDDPAEAKSLGEYFVKSAGEDRLRQLAASPAGVKINDLPEYAPKVKAADDPHGTAGLTAGIAEGWGTTYERGIVNQRRERLVVADLMSNLQVTNPVIKYLVEKNDRIAEGGFAIVDEGTKKPYIRFENFDIQTESLAKIAGLTKLTDEMVSDFDFVAQWINNQLLYELSVAEENQLLNGDGTGNNLTGLLNRSGLQNMDVADLGALPDQIYRATTAISLATPLTADALLINPADYQEVRLQRDGNDQYLGGGFFQGQYGNGGVMIDPPIWGLRTVQTQAVPAGTAVVGAFKQGATILRKGGVRVDSTGSNVDDFENNLVTFRAEERVGLMVQHPAAFVKLNVAEVTP